MTAGRLASPIADRNWLDEVPTVAQKRLANDADCRRKMGDFGNRTKWPAIKCLRQLLGGSDGARRGK